MTRLHRPLPSQPVLIILIVLGLAIGIGLGIVARGENVLGWDVDVTTTLQGAQGAFVEKVAELGHKLGSTLLSSVAIAIALIVAIVFRGWAEVIFLVTLLVLRLAGTYLKPIFDSPRPTSDLVGIVGEWSGTGYPSGHALTAATMALGLSVIAWQRIPSRTLMIATIAMILTLGVIIGWARIWTGAHWSSDVIGGYGFGLAITSASVIVLKRYRAATVATYKLTSSPSVTSGEQDVQTIELPEKGAPTIR